MSSARPMRRFSHRVFKIFVVSLLAVCTIFTAYFVYLQKQRLETSLLDRGQGLAGLLATGARIGVYAENERLVRETLKSVVDRRDVLSAAVFTEDGTLLSALAKHPAFQERAGTISDAERTVLASPQLRTGCVNLPGRQQIDFFCPVLLRTPGAPEQEQELEPEQYFESRATPGGEVAGFVQVTFDRRSIKRELGSLIVRSLALMLVTVLLGAWAGFHFARRVTGPLERLTEAVRVFGARGQIGELHDMPDDEIGRLAEAFTTMTRDLAEREREQLRLAERLRESQKMEAVGALSQGISHDFKNILSTLKAAVHILQKGSPDNEFVLKYTGKIQTSLGRAHDLVERLVTFSRTRRLQDSPVDLVAMLEQLAPMLKEAVGERVRLDLETPPGPVRVFGEAASLEQLVLNLAYNARDAMPDGGVLRVRLETVDAAGTGEPGIARISVRDTGAGIVPEALRRIFEPFFTTKDIGSGLGLGLSIVHGIVAQHHGRIDVASEPGKGTTFLVELPLFVERGGERQTAAGTGGDA